MAFIESQSLPSHLRVLGLIAGGRRLCASELVLDEDKHYFRFDDDDEWQELVSARLITGMCRKKLIEGGDFFQVTRFGHRLLRQHAS